MVIKAIFFDYGRVIANFDFLDFAKKIKPYTPFSIDAVVQKTVDKSPLLEFQNGKIKSKDFFIRLKHKLRISQMPYKEFRSAWQTVCGSLTPGIDRIFSVIKPEIKMFILSTNNELHWAHHKKTNKYLGRFFPHSRQRILSHKIGASKPDDKIFKTAFRRGGCNPKLTIFIDDNKEYLAAFRKFGGNTIYFDCRIHSIGYLFNKLDKFNVFKIR